MTSIGSSLQFLEKFPRTHHNAALRAENINQDVVLMGWIHTRRDHGGVVFIDLRDIEGLTQVVFDPQIHAEAHKLANELRSEYCIGIRGKVRGRPDGMKNSKLPTGDIEVAATHLEIFNTSRTPPFPIEDGIQTNEMVRLEHRYLDLRRPEAAKAIVMRSKLTHFIRQYMDERKFFEIETPFLTKSTPEGARDYLVPSRLYPGQAYALPQSPQLFKQLLMMAGFERYYQIARCFRDEDLRADRQPDFTQLDIEMSYITQDRLFEMMEGLWKFLWKNLLNVDIPTPFVRMKYADAMEKYGSDKPDLRLDWVLTTVTDIFANSGFKVFKDVSDKKDLIQALRVPNGAELSRKDLDDLTPFAKNYGAKGIAWIKINKIEDYAEGWQSPISKFLSDAEKKALADKTGLKTGDLLLFCADKKKVVADSLGNIRLELGRKMNLIKKGDWKFLWVIDFPMFQWDDDGKRWVSEHHPFTSPKPEFVESFYKDPGKAIANGYDLVLNGMEMGSGSIRIHSPELQAKIFELLNLSNDEAREKFGFLLDALSYGAPPHGGVAFGIDRIAMVLAGGESLRDVIAFPKTQRGQCPLTKAPSDIPAEQWKELHLKVSAVVPTDKVSAVVPKDATRVTE